MRHWDETARPDVLTAESEASKQRDRGEPELPGLASDVPESMMPTKYPTGTDLEGSTVVDAAMKVLYEQGQGTIALHYIEIADRAAARGYRGRKPGTQTLHQTFWALMNRAPQIFAAAGGGTFRLTEGCAAELKRNNRSQP